MGGAAGHMMHPFDNGLLTKSDIENIFDEIAKSNIEVFEKVDGFNLFVTFRNGQLFAARNKTTLKNPMTISDLRTSFSNEQVGNIFADAAKRLEDVCKNVNLIIPEDAFINLEIIHSDCDRLYNCVIDAIVIHNISLYEDSIFIKKLDINILKKLLFRSIDHNFDILLPNQLIINCYDQIMYKQLKNELLNLLPENGTLNDMYGFRIHEYLSNTYNINVPEAIPHIVDRWIMKHTSNMKDIKQYMNVQDGKLFTQIDKKVRYKIVRQIRHKIEAAIYNLGNYILTQVYNKTLTYLDLNKIIDLYRFALIPGNVKPEILDIMKLLKHNIAYYEGIVFEYKGLQYKLTGHFAVLNQVFENLRNNS